MLGVVNELLPSDKQLNPDIATGKDLVNAVNSLPPDQQAIVMSKELDVDIIEEQEFTKRIQALGEVDKTGHSTRPKIADRMAWLVAYAVFVAITMWGVCMSVIVWQVVVTLKAIRAGSDAAGGIDPVEAMKVVKDSWPFILAVLGIPSALLRAYFAMRSKEKNARVNMAIADSGQAPPASGIAGLIGSFLKR